MRKGIWFLGRDDRWSKIWSGVEETKLDLPEKVWIRFGVGEPNWVFRPCNQVCTTLQDMHEIFQYFISFIGPVGAKIAFAALLERGPFAWTI